MPENYTHIRFINPLELNNIDIEVNSVLITTSAWYSRELPIVFKKKNDTDRGVLSSNIMVQVKNETESVESAPFQIRVTAEANLSVTPSGETKSDSLSEPTSFLDLVNLNDGVDRIKIISSEGNAKVSYNNQPIYSELKLYLFELQNLIFDNLIEVSSSEYHTFNYQVGNSEGYEETIYTLTIERLVDAELELVSEELFEIDEDENNDYYIGLVLIKNPYPDFPSKFTFDITETTSTIADLMNNEGQVLFRINGNDEQIVLNNVSNEFNLDAGIDRFFLEAKIPKSLTVDFTFLITLTEIDNSVEAVGINNFVSLNIKN